MSSSTAVSLLPSHAFDCKNVDPSDDMYEACDRVCLATQKANDAVKQLSQWTSRKTSLGITVQSWECLGDYTDEKWMEDPSLPLYSEQHILPRLPVPSLEETVAMFRPTALPLANGRADDIESLEAACAAFPQQASALQERLLQRRDEWKDSSWLQEWWNKNVYLRPRDSNVMHVSYFLRPNWSPKLYEDNPNLLPCYGSALYRGAMALQAAVEYGQTISEGTKETDYCGNKKSGKAVPLCSTQFKYLLSACRIPHKNEDTYRLYKAGQAQHAVVVCKGQFFALPLTDANTGKVLPLHSLEDALQDCVEQSSKVASIVPELGWLTCVNRDTWAEAYEQLFLNTSKPELTEALETLQSALCVICLDLDDEEHEDHGDYANGHHNHQHHHHNHHHQHHHHHDDDRPELDDSSVSSAEEEERRVAPKKVIDNQSDTEHALRLWHGNEKYSANRWHDKSSQLVFNSHGQFGYIGEHTMADGCPAADFCQFVLEKLGAGEQHSEEALATPVVEVTPIFKAAFERLSEKDRSQFQMYIEQARADLLGRIQTHEMQCLNYERFGREDIKRFGHAPDAFVQIAIQLAAFRLLGEPIGTYEATQTRRFLHGRTETTRTVSPASFAFCQAMQEDDGGNTVDDEHKRALLRAATESHVDYTRKAVSGLGVDRHFFGLSMLLQEGERAPDLFSHPLYLQAKRWRLSTSNVPNSSPGFGNVEKDGLGIGYDIRYDGCAFTISAKKEYELVPAFTRLLEQTLNEMGDLCTKK